MPRYRRYFKDGQTVFLTLATAHRDAWLACAGARDSVLAALRETRMRLPFVHHGHVLLDDHLHLLIAPASGVEASRIVGNFKRAAILGLANAGIVDDPRLWQRRYYDHIIRDAEDFARHLDYLHFNPVKHGLTTDAGTWRWSSLAAWQARGIYPAGWGRDPPDGLPIVGE